MNYIKSSAILVYITSILAFSDMMAFSQNTVLRNKAGEEPNLQEYYYALGEATKLYLFGNYSQAVNLYNECLKVNPESAVSHYQLAKIFIQAGEMNMAKEHAREASRLDPENKWYLQELAGLYQVNEEYDSAIMIYERQLNGDPENLSVIYMIASLYERTGKFDESLNYLNKIDEKIGISKETAISRYRIYESMGLNQKALVQLKLAGSLSENDYSINGMLAEFFRNHNEPDSAFHYYNQIYPEHKDDPAVSFSYTEFLLEQKKYNDATNVLSTAMTNNAIDNISKAGYIYKIIQDERLFKLTRPILDTVVTGYYEKYYGDLRSISVYTDIEVRLGNYNKASSALKRIIGIDNRNYAAFEQLIFSENAQGNMDSVEKYSYKAIMLFPEKPIPYLFAGSANYQKSRYEAAIIKLEDGLKWSDNDNLKLEFYSLLAECNEKINLHEKSEEYFNKALRIDSSNLAIRNNYAYYLALRKKDLHYAKELSTNTIVAEPENSTYLDTYGYILYRMGKLRTAKKYISKAIEYGGEKNAEILLHYGDILSELNKQKEAVVIWKRALEFSDKDQRIELEKRIQTTGFIKKQ